MTWFRLVVILHLLSAATVAVEENVTIFSTNVTDNSGVDLLKCYNTSTSNLKDEQNVTVCNNSETSTESNDKGNNPPSIDYVGYVVVPLFFVVGVCGNSLTISVMLGKRFRKMTSSWILIALSVSDTIFCCILPFNKKFVRTMLGFDVRALSAVGCSIFFVIHKTSKMSSSWFTVFICFERFVAVCFPLKTKFICSKRHAIIGIAAVYVFMFTFNGVWDLSTKIVNGVCVPNYATPVTTNLARIFLILGTAAYSLIPVGIMLVLTPAICIQLTKQARRRSSMTHAQRTQNGEVKTTVMLLAITFACMILVTPISVAHNVSFALGENFFETSNRGLLIVREVLQVMEQLNYSINFFLYVLCCRAFRRRISVMFGCGNPRERGRDRNTGTSLTSIPTISK